MSSASVKWSASADPSVAGYCVYYGTSSGAYTTRLDTGTNVSTTVTGLTGGVTYYFAATAYDSAKVESTTSAEVQLAMPSGSAPVLLTIPNQIVNVQDSLVITNQASETGLAPKKFTYTLDPGAPARMRLNSTNGVLRWIPQFSDAGLTYPVTVRATDNSTPPVSSTVTFNVVVGHAAQLNFNSAVVAAGTTGTVALVLQSSISLTNFSFNLDAPTGRISSVTAQSLLPAIASVTQVPSGSNHSVITIKGINGQTLPTQQPIVQLTFVATAGQHSAFTGWPASSVTATDSTGKLLPRAFGANGRVVVVGVESLVDGTIQTNGQRGLTIYGPVGKSYAVELASNPKGGSWTTAYSGTLTNLMQSFPAFSSTNKVAFYRCRTF